MQQPLISVIVPIYNVEKNVRKCLESLRGQSLNLIEVICIDDGSTDNSGKIAEEYTSEEFPIFRVIHTENQGLSAARNRGIDEVRTDWVMFVDSDDWVSEDFCRIPYEWAIGYGADLVCFRSYRVTRFGRIKKPKKTDAPTGIVDEMTAHEKVSAAAWNKLYKVSLFKNIRYPEGHVYEEVATTHKIVHLARRIVRIEDCLYYYISRNKSISHVHSEKQQMDSFISWIERYTELKDWGYSVGKLKPNLCSAAMGFLIYTPYSKDRLHEKAEEIINSTDKFPKSYPVFKKIALRVWKMNKQLFLWGGRIVTYIRK